MNKQPTKEWLAKDEIKEVLVFAEELFDKVCDILDKDKDEIR